KPLQSWLSLFSTRLCPSLAYLLRFERVVEADSSYLRTMYEPIVGGMSAEAKMYNCKLTCKKTQLLTSSSKY
ncbi:hypothetical protein J3E68DRAFT_397634, partial [Trichoderma sp. SZMC 28012]